MKPAGLLLLLISLFFVIPGKAQQRRLDSLLALAPQYHKDDSLKVIYLKDVFRAYASVKNYAKVSLYADSAVKIARGLSNKKLLAYIHQRIGLIYHVSDRLQAITNYRQSIEAAHEAGAVRTEAGSYLNLGALYQGIGDFPASLDAHERALALYASIGDKDEMVSCYMNLANIYNGMQQRVQAISYARKALDAFEAGKSYRGMGVAYDVLGSTYLSASNEELFQTGILPENRFRIAAEMFEKGLKAAKLSGDAGLMASFYTDFGRLNEMTGKNETALQYFLQAQELSKDRDNDQETYLDNLLLTGVFYLKKLKDIPKAKQYLYEAMALSKRIARLPSQQDALTALSDLHEANRNFDSALYYFKNAIVIRDNILNEEKENEITRKQLKMDFDMKEREYKETQLLTDAKLKQQVMLAREREQELLLRKQQLEISNKEKSLQRLLFLQKQAELEAQKKVQAGLLVQEHLKAEYDKKIRDQQIDVQNVEIAANRRLTFFLGAMAVIVLAVAFFIFKSRMKTVKLNRLVSEQKAELEELVKVKDKIFSIVSHDMRAPINNLVAFSSLLEEGEIGQEKLAKYIDQVKGTLDHTSSMMENLLNWSASQMQGFTPVTEQVFLDEMVADVIAGIEPALQKKKLYLDNRVETGVKVLGDRNMIELIIRNLLNNAIKFSKAGTRLELFQMKEENKGMVVFSVKDNGVGLPQSKADKINAASVVTMESTYGTQKEKGTGLGLMLCKHFAALMKGRISVTSKEGEGSIFRLTLPLA
jgi:signal transduction histidine kinase